MEGNKLKTYRRELRQSSTPAEKILWAHLRGRRLGGLKFRRQVSVGPFIVDFLHFDSRTVIEIDGDIHFVNDNNLKKDKTRQAWLEKQGYKVYRYNNVDIRNNLENILNEIYYNILTMLKILK